ncbi:hypothetical protein [Lacticaseibacillus zhaodongensis]|uniref:hypothetical protein n=1 Tax=Lacticaseibacillus zhaodongensis TaxID=2668065 RepID=UPI0012D32710|nr:hypothetical protein [Lacticaseibacillus zhaodongensis]
MHMTREQMLNFLTTARPEVSKDFWETFDDVNLMTQVKLVRRSIEQQASDALAMS